MVEGTTSRKSWSEFQDNMGGCLATFLLATVLVLMVTMAVLVVVFLASSSDEKDNTAKDVLNRDNSDLFDGEVPGADIKVLTPTVKITAATTTRPVPMPTPRTPASRPPATTPTKTTATKLTPLTTTPTSHSPMPRPSTPTRSPSKITPSTTTSTTTTRKSLLAGSLLCTLGTIDFSKTFIYPLDGVCDLITFDSLFVAGGTTLSPPYSADFKTFLNIASGHRLTAYGIGIDHNFCRNQNLMSELVANPTTKTTLDDMWSKRIHHYGQVNTPVMQASDKPLEYVTQSARGLKMISELVRDRANTDGKPSYVILHYPLMYESMVAGVAQALKSYPVDMLVAIGYTTYTDYGTKDCRMVPPVLHSEQLLEPSLLNTSYPVRLVRVVSAMVKLKKEHAATSALAVSFGMGGRWYTPTYPDNLPDTPGNGSLGQPCTTSSRGGGPNGRQITGIAEGCANKRPFDYDDIFQAEYLYNRTENMLFTFDTSASFRYKLYDTEGIDQDLKYNLAADNIQHEDFDNTCGRGPYSRMRLLKILAGHKGKLTN